MSEMFGLYDTEDSLWMGTEEGPLLYSDEMFARVAAMICDRSLRQRAGRTRARPFTGDTVRLHDSKVMHESAEEALAKLEMGYF